MKLAVTSQVKEAPLQGHPSKAVLILMDLIASENEEEAWQFYAHAQK